MNMDGSTVSGQWEGAGAAEATLAGRLLLISSIIFNLFEDEDYLLVLASVINLIAGVLTVRAAQLESVEQQIAPGVTTFANGLKLIGSQAGVAVSAILLWSLLIEVSIKQVTAVGAEPTFAGSLGAFLVE